MEDFYNLTNPQKSIWNMEKFFDGTTVANIFASVTILDKLDTEILKQAVYNVVRKNDSFRIRIIIKDNVPMQYISEFKPFEIETFNLKKDVELEKIKKEMGSQRFNVIDSNLFCFKIAKFADGHGILLFNIHHTIADSWSLGIFSQRVMSEYNKLKNNEEVSEESDNSYIDYIISENEYKQSKKYESDKEYWSKIFETIPEQVTLPDGKNTNLPDASRESFMFRSDISEKIKSFCDKNKISVFNFFMSIYSLYLAKISGLDEFVIGTPILNRTNFKEKQTMGMFVNTIPVKVTLNRDDSFSDFAKAQSSSMLSNLKHQKYSYTQILEDLRKENSSLSNLYNVVISYQITKAYNKDCGNYSADWYQNNYSPNDCSIHITDLNDTGELLIHYDYLTEKYNKKYFHDLHNRVIFIINQILENEEISIENISILTQSEESDIINKFNDTKIKYPENLDMIDMFERNVLENPNKIAVIFENEKLTYRELNERANSLANFLIDNGITSNDYVSILLDRSYNIVISVYAVIKAGASYVIIDKDYPEERINYILRDCKSKFTITNRLIDNFDYSKYDNKNLGMAQNYRLCTIYTSGSTGNPKGVLLHKYGYYNLVNAFDTDFELSSFKKVLGIANVSFDMFAFEMFSSTLLGNTLVLANVEEQKNPIAMSKLIKDNDVEFMVTTPSRAELLLLEECGNPLENIKAILLGGEKFTSNLYLRLKEATNAKIFNSYGPTEITSACTNKLITSTDITVGKPLPNTKVYICDSKLHLLPVGVIGEMCVGGVGVTDGYSNNPKASKEHFVDNPFGEGKLYRTGDLARFREDGEIEYIDRLDDQVKIRGLRIELGEIESIVLKYPNIQKVVVIKQSEGTREYLSCYYISNKDANISNNELRKFISKYLPNYMIPSYFIKLDDFKYTQNGKIDKKYLAQFKNQTSQKENVLPRNETDKKLIKILENILNVKNISIEDSFLELGGDSLSAINLVINIQSEFGVKIFVRDILENLRIKNISDLIDKSQKISKVQKLKKIEKAPFYPVSSAQKRMYISSKMAGDTSTAYNIAGGLIFEQKLNVEKIKNCFNKLIERHEVFRTSFDMSGNEIIQKISDKVDFNVETIEKADFSNIEIIFKNFLRPFDLSRPPLLRAEFVDFTNNKSALFINMHHIISDGASMDIFINEFCKLYNDESLEEIKFTYKDFSVFENNRINSKEYKEAETYWINQFETSEIPVLNMPTNYQRPSVKGFEGNRVYSSVPKDIFKKIEELAKSLNLTPYMILLSSYYILLSKYTSGDDIIVGSPIVGRDLIETQNMLGMFVNTLALRSKIDENLSFKEYLESVKNTVLEGYKYQIYPFDELVNKLDLRRDSSRSVLFDTMFIYQNNGYRSFNIGDIKSKYFIPNSNTSKYDISLEVIPENNSLTLYFDYSTSLFKQEFIEKFAEHYLRILDIILENNDIKISDLDILTSEEQEDIINKFNDTKIKYPENLDMIDMFERNVLENPNKIAVIFENEKLTYRELNERANSLANFLIDNGITSNDYVSILLDRSYNIVISVYAVIKAGASYVIIDKDYPEERINYILRDCKSKFTITNRLIDNFDYSKYDNKNLGMAQNYRLCTIYTSGSTGNPKGVLLHKYGYYNLVNAFDTDFELSSFKKVLGIANVSFDMFAFEMFSSTLLGNTLVLANVEEQKNPIAMSKLIKDNDVEFMVTTPSRAELLLLEECGNPLENIKAILLGGEKFTSNLYLRLKEATNAKIFNSYGPTEITSACTNKLITSTDITVGKPLPNTKVYICDSKLHLLPVGVIGEMCVGGVGVTDGYSNNPKASKEHFVDNPFGEGKLYRTGDLARFREDGEIEYIDRLDDQVKIRGLRIELGEIESLILRYPNIKKTTIIKQTVNNREFLSAYYVADKKIVHSDLRKYLSKYLPNYMVPSYYTALNDFKYTKNGKVDKRSLPLPTGILNITKENYVAPTTDLQKKLVSIWEKVLNTKPVGVTDNFFELGGDSLLAMNLNIELLKITTKVSYSDIFHFPTILELEEKINATEVKPVFSKIENLPEVYEDILEKNTKHDKIQTYEPKGILLTGATGFLGIHLLDEFLRNSKTNIYCIVRNQPGISVTTKLIQKLNYYFGDKYNDLVNTRIFALCGDISESQFGLNQEDFLKLSNDVDTVINCAANVAHFGNYKDFYKSNVSSTKLIIDFCKTFNKKLYHISTTGIGGVEIDMSYLKRKRDKKTKVKFDERSLYIGQILDNVYSRSKFEAENCVLDAINSGVDAYILRMGNLMPRYNDGTFQENVQDNAFLNKFAAFIKTGIMPEYMLKHILNFTPIDYASNAVYKLVLHPSNKNRIFHIYNNKNISVKKYLKKSKFKVKILTEEDFVKEIKKILENEFEKDTIKNLIDDFDSNLHLSYVSNIVTKSKFTTKYLRKIGFKWPQISKEYINKFDNILRRVVE